MSDAEEWRDVVGYEGYYMVSSLGRIKRILPRCGTFLGRIRKPELSRRGYYRVQLHKDGGRGPKVMVHRIVAEAYCERHDGATEVNHIDGNKANNAAANLEWCTRSRNEKHKRWVLGMMIGETHHMAKLSTARVLAIRALARAGEPFNQMAEALGITAANVGMVVRRKTWRHVA